MRQFSVITLLLVFVFNTVGYTILFEVAKYDAKEQAKDRVRKAGLSNLTAITINDDNLFAVEWFDDGEEMLFEGKMYDIVTVSEGISSVTYYCMADDREKLLITGLEGYMDEFICQRKSGDTGAKKISAATKIYFPVAFELQLNSSSGNVQYSDYREPLIASDCLESHTPPPEQHHS